MTADGIPLSVLDSLVVDVLSDNVSDTYVSKTSFAVSEIDNVVASGATVISGETLLVANLGYPAGFPRVMTYDVTNVVSRDTPRLRIRTSFEIYWDKVWLSPRCDAAKETRVTTLAPGASTLRWVGYPRETKEGGCNPPVYDYGTLEPSMPWKTMEGDFTRYGGPFTKATRTAPAAAISRASTAPSARSCST